MLLDGGSTVIESQDVKIAENAEAVPFHDIDYAVIQFNLSDDSAIFDDIVCEAEQPADESEREIQSIVSKM